MAFLEIIETSTTWPVRWIQTMSLQSQEPNFQWLKPTLQWHSNERWFSHLNPPFFCSGDFSASHVWWLIFFREPLALRDSVRKIWFSLTKKLSSWGQFAARYRFYLRHAGFNLSSWFNLKFSCNWSRFQGHHHCFSIESTDNWGGHDDAWDIRVSGAVDVDPVEPFADDIHSDSHGINRWL